MKLQWRLRTAVLGLAIATLPLAWIAQDYRAASQDEAIAGQLLGHGVVVGHTRSSTEWWRPWNRQHVFLVEMLELHYRFDAAAGRRTVTADLVAMARLGHLRDLTIHGNLLAADDFQHLGRLIHLEKLLLSHVPIDDEQLQHLASLKNLRELTLEATSVTDAGLDRLRATLPNLQVYDD